MIKTGTTLLEVTLATGVIAVIGIILVLILVNNSNIFSRQSTNIQQGIKVDNVLRSIRQDFKMASSVSFSYPESGTALYTSGNSQIVLKISSIDASGNLIAGSYDYIIYFLDTDELRMKLYPDILSSRIVIDQLIASGVGLSFEYFDRSGITTQPKEAHRVKITLSLNQKTGEVLQTKTATSEAILRND